ncbi:MAG: YigZ family protein [Lachnospiraceae bacterium]|nr:YigZ family protein [Lachnospiraceae bacterium]MCR5087591.1 YigZ family protein [Lachnospiraceae bacterium]
MNSPIKYLYKGGSGEIVVKRSRFLATLTPVASEEEASAFIEAQKKLYWDARHNCQATVIGDNAEFTRCSDDGEPPHTAGRPMLDILLHEEIRNVCVVVTRYFGGILLGTGGLVRAYQDAVTEGLKNCVIAQKQRAVPVTVRTDYTGIGRIQHRTAEAGYPSLSVDYTDIVTAVWLVPAEECDAFRAAVHDATQGRAEVSFGDSVWYSSVDGGPVTLI